MNRLLVVVFCCAAGFVQAQDVSGWQLLAEVGFETIPAGKNGFEIEKPTFSKRLKEAHGKRITLKGYLVPLSEVGGKQQYMFSSLPFSSCYFCGGAGPETVIELDTKEKIKFVTKQITLEGTLILNASDPDHHIFILRNPTSKP
jgi:hypothetical protein